MKRFRPLNRLESTLERAVEGSVDRVFRPSIQPSEICRKLSREMADRQMVSVRGPIVPNAFEVSLHPEDLATYQGSEEAIAQHTEEWLEDEVDRLGFVTVGKVQVTLLPCESCRPRSISVQSSHRETSQEPQTRQYASGQTEAFWVQPVRSKSPALLLEVVSGPHTGLAHYLQKAQTSVGRSLDNDWVIDAVDVSRHHAMIETQNGILRIIDLSSLNGTFVNRQRIVTWAQLNPGDYLTFGLVEVRLSHDLR